MTSPLLYTKIVYCPHTVTHLAAHGQQSNSQPVDCPNHYATKPTHQQHKFNRAFSIFHMHLKKPESFTMQTASAEFLQAGYRS